MKPFIWWAKTTDERGTMMKHTFRRDGKTAVVQTAQGKIQGYEHDGLQIFKGIPVFLRVCSGKWIRHLTRDE